MAPAGTITGLVIEAFRSLGKDHVTKARIEHIRRLLPLKDRQKLLKDIRFAPTWMQPYIRQIADDS
jgi:hypothetical protein